MKNFGLTELRLVAPRDGWPNVKAHEMAAHADHIIEDAQLYSTLPEALHDCHLALASTARPREMTMPCHTPREAASAITQNAGRTAFVFGQENNGLNNDDIAACHAIVTIPTDAYSSLNLAQSVVVLAYEYFTAHHASHTKNTLIESATMGEIDGLYQDITTRLTQSGHYPNSNRGEAMRRQLRQTLLGANLTSAQTQSLRGMVKSLHKAT